MRKFVVFMIPWLLFAAFGMASTNSPEGSLPAGTALDEGTSVRQPVTGPQAGEQLKRSVVAAAGGQVSGGSFRVSFTLSQSAAGVVCGTSNKVNQGFWQPSGALSCGSEPCNCGDADGSGGSADISDAVFLIAYIFGGGPAPNPVCLGDADGSGGIDISDAVYLIAYIFGGGPAPHCP